MVRLNSKDAYMYRYNLYTVCLFTLAFDERILYSDNARAARTIESKPWRCDTHLSIQWHAACIPLSQLFSVITRVLLKYLWTVYRRLHIACPRPIFKKILAYVST